MFTVLLWILTFIVGALVTWSLQYRGRPWYRNQYSQKMIDGWSVTHIGHGIVLYSAVRMLFNGPIYQILPIVIIIEILWESFENRNWLLKLFRQTGDKNYWGDSIMNSVGDLLSCICGALITSPFIN